MFLPSPSLIVLASVISAATVLKVTIPTATPGAYPFTKQPGQSSFIVELKKDTSLHKRSHDEFHKRSTDLNIDYSTWIPIDANPELPHITGSMDTTVALKMADVDKLHALGIKGKGMKIAFVDTGIDYTHPSLGRGFGPGFKVAGGFGFGMIGVAPEASTSAKDGVDVISMSLGSLNPFQGATPCTSLVNAITSQGIAVVAANDNDGDIGTYGQSTPARSDGSSYKYSSVWPLILSSALTVYSHGVLCTQSAWANTAAAYNKDPANIIVIAGVTRSCSLSAQMSAAAYYGIRYLIAYNVEQDPVSQDSELQIPFEVTTLVVDPRTGASILRKAKPGSTYKMSFTDPTVKSVRFTTGGMTSNFSSFGPTWDTVALKPQLSAPSGKILSTWPLGPHGGYAIISGISMATPFVAACYALVRSQNLGLSAQQVIGRMQSTSEPMPYVYDHSFPSTVAGQGAGMVNPYKAITYKTTITPSQIELRDRYIYENAPQTIRIDNASPKAKTYTIKHQGAGYVEFFPYPDILESAAGNAYGQPQYLIYGSASFDVTTVTIAAGGFYKLAVKFSPPKLTPAQIQKVPVFSGFIQISTSGEDFTVPYLGLPYDKRKTNAIDLSNVTIFDGVEEHKCAQPCLFNYPGVYDDDPTWNFPNIYVNLLTGGADFEVHVLPGNTTFVPTHYGYDPNVETKEYQDPNHTPHDTFMGFPSYGSVPDRSQFNNAGPSETKYNFLPFTTTVTFLWGAVYFHDYDGEHWGEYLPNGDYRIVISMLKPGVAEWDDAGWEHWLSPMIRLEGDWANA
ncbi:hypothetical protein DL95DRAFT_525352 [Leptodontidium sp. 2 PMI_412]|nr:hypothetical protein DL95DRAFT_525352 [Leptodontidium sp. 2 PMI_412]